MSWWRRKRDRQLEAATLVDDAIDDAVAEGNVTDDRCPECGEYESECTCHEEAA